MAKDDSVLSEPANKVVDLMAALENSVAKAKQTRDLRAAVMDEIADEPTLRSLPSPFHIIDRVLSAVPSGWIKTDDGWMKVEVGDDA